VERATSSRNVEGSTAIETRVPLAVHEATRSLLRATTAADARRTAEELVRGVGGGLVTPSADRADSADVIPADLSFGEGEPLLASAPQGRASRVLLERYLTQFLLDANRVLELTVRTERLAESASTDALTGLPNRRMIDRALGRLGDGDLVVILDLDHFKQVNDEHGHAGGDDVLRAFGGVLRQTARGRDVVGRFGGEEFVAVLDAPGAGADAFLKRLRKTWCAHRPLPVSFSAGIARSVGEPDETIRLADEALYRAKNAGRDRWCWAATAGASTKALPGDYLQPYLADAVQGRRRPAIGLTIDLLDKRVPSAVIVEDLLAAAQREVGERWQRNQLTTADEHLASGVTSAALDALTGEATPSSSSVLTVVTCAEGDWHSLAAQMFGASLRSYGIGVRVLGASTPAEAVAEFLDRSGGDSLAVSCSMSMFFPGAARLADAAHAQGIPVLMGGRALGADARRAVRLGADAWAGTARDAAAVLAEWKANPPRIDASPTRLSAVGLRLASEADAMGTLALGEVLSAGLPAVDAWDGRQLDDLGRDLALVVHFLAAAIIVDETAVLTDFLAWLRTVSDGRGVPPQVLAAGLETLGALVGRTDPGAGVLLGVGRD
jgi:diguanylate cyclase (GGDEF)-like protein